MTSQSFRVPYFSSRAALFAASFAIGVGLAPAIVSTPAAAELKVGGSASAVTIDAQNASIKEILDTLGKSFDVHFQSTASLDRRITGTYEGPLSKVLIRILEGYSVIMKTGKDGIQVTVLGTKNGTSVAAVPAAPTVVAASSASTVAATLAQAAQPSLAGDSVEAPAPGASPASSSNASPSASSPFIVVAEGPAPPVPTGDAAQNAMPVRPSTVAPPTPVVGSSQAAFPIGKATTNLPPVPSNAAAQTAAPQPGAGTAPAPGTK